MLPARQWSAIIGLVLVVALAITGCTVSPSISGTPALSGSLSFSQQQTGIWVNGEGKVTVVPDVAILNLGVEAQAPTVSEAQGQAASSMDAIVKELKGQGVADRDIKTVQFSIFPVRRFVRERDEEVLIGYRVSNMVTARIRKVENAGPVIDAVSRAGGDNARINSITFTVDNPAAYHKEAREKAMADAGSKARQLAELGGVRLGKPTFISESGGFIPVSPAPGRVALEAAPAMPVTPVSPGETEIRLNVQVVYSIQ